MAELTIQTTSGSRELIPQASDIYQHAFRDDPVITYLLSALSRPQRLAILYDYFTRLLTGAALNSALFTLASGPGGLTSDQAGSCIVLMPPGTRVDNPWTLIPAGLLGALWTLGWRGCYRMLGEYVPLSDAAKAKGLKGVKEYYYVFFLGTRPEAEGGGLGSALIRAAQAKAREEGVPLWLEATTPRSMELYEKLGFEVVEEMVLGKGRADAEGLVKKGGEGVPVWGLVWWPEKADGDAVVSK